MGVLYLFVVDGVITLFLHSVSSLLYLFWVVAPFHLLVLLLGLCNGETLGSQGSDVLLSGGEDMHVLIITLVSVAILDLAIGSCIVQINVGKVTILLLVGQDGTTDLDVHVLS